MSKLKSKRKNILGMDFDTEGFILEVQNRPAIWNTRCMEYNDRELRIQAWNEVVDIYSGDQPMSRLERKQLGLHLRKKWRNVRDCFVKVHKAKTKGDEDKKKIHYAFYDNLLFLAESVTGNTVFNVTDFKHDTHNDEDEPLSSVSKILKRKISHAMSMSSMTNMATADPLSESGDSAISTCNKKEKTQMTHEKERRKKKTGCFSCLWSKSLIKYRSIRGYRRK